MCYYRNKDSNFFCIYSIWQWLIRVRTEGRRCIVQMSPDVKISDVSCLSCPLYPCCLSTSQCCICHSPAPSTISTTPVKNRCLASLEYEANTKYCIIYYYTLSTISRSKRSKSFVAVPRLVVRDNDNVSFQLNGRQNTFYVQSSRPGQKWTFW